MTDATGEAAAMRAATVSLVYGFAFSQVAGTVARLGVPAALGEQAEHVEKLAAATGTHAPSLLRLLRAAAGLGVLTEHPGDRFALTALGAALRDEPSLRALLDLYGDRSVWAAYGALEDAVRTGRSGFEAAHGTGLFDVLEEDEALAGRFHGAMTGVTAAQVPAIVRACDVAAGAHVVDVGGGDGTLLAALLGARPGLRGTLVERPGALPAARRTLAAAGVAEDRCAVVEGDFFASVPDGGDAYLLKNILHNWSDADCVRLLRTCGRAAAARGGRVLVPTLVLPDGDAPGGREEAALMALSDVEMMVLTSGRERTRAEYDALFAAADLEPGASVPLEGLPGHHLLTAWPRPS
ncbi:methyltransferase [Streptomyces sp. DSM 42041]|uniref:Methyltransferase n=1 Tax=Streptomyces hazeniae TaxID=3075538 RepID=A0ABU2NL04_9ACTN|nr:methyltransferase [Streptomyces sp. DSM 42041]MDT0377593.1 methyltransferase [Streptomyces sp. DSM 42041]